MPLEIESPDSRTATDAWRGSSGKLLYKLQAAPDEDELALRRYLASVAPRTFDAVDEGAPPYRRASISLKLVEADIFDAEVSYSQLKPNQYSGETGSGSQKITSSIETVSRWNKDGMVTTSGVVPDFQQGINVTKNGVDGVDLPIGQPTFTVSRTWLLEYITAEYLDALEDSVYRFNDDDFEIEVLPGVIRTYKLGELRFDGATWQVEDDHVEFSYKFSVSRGKMVPEGESPSVLNTITIGDITVTEKLGWDYLWVSYEETNDANVRVQRPRAVYIERVYYAMDFTAYRLGEDLSQ